MRFPCGANIKIHTMHCITRHLMIFIKARITQDYAGYVHSVPYKEEQ